MPDVKRFSVDTVMSKEPITAEASMTVNDVAKIMRDNDVGSVVVVNSSGYPVGVVTERDLVVNVLAMDRDPFQIVISSIMSKPIISISPMTTLVDAARLMSKRNIRRLVVISNGRMVGIITARDILRVAPGIIDILVETAKISDFDETISFEGESLTGYCDECGEWSDSLVEVDGAFLCPDCRVMRGL